MKGLIDLSGREIIYTYSEDGDLQKVDFHGRVKEYSYSTDSEDISLAHNLLTYKDPEGQQVLSISYDSDKQDKVVSIDRGGSSTTFSCGASATVTDGNGNSKTFSHDDKGHPTAISAGGYATTFAYNDDGLVTKVTYPEGNSINYSYMGPVMDNRPKGNLMSMQESPGPRGSSDPGQLSRATSFRYETWWNQVTSVSTPDGLEITKSGQDKQGNFCRVSTNIPGVSYSYSYTEHGRLQSETGPSGLSRTYGYSAGGRGYLATVSSPFEKEIFLHDEVGNLTGYSSSRGFSSSYSVNKHGEVTSENTSASGSFSPMFYSGSYTYNKNGLVTAANTTYGTGERVVQNSSSYTYDRRYNMLSESESSRGATSYTYDANDNVTGISGPVNAVSFSYNSRDLISSMTTGGGTGARAYSFSYDGSGNMASSVDSYGHTTVYEYDGFDRLHRTIDPLGNQTVLARGNLGNLLTIKKLGSGGEVLRETTRLNDPLGRLTQYVVKVPGAAVEVYNYAYADSGKTVTVTDSLLRSWTVKKNDFGQVYEETGPAGNKTQYFYLDGRGNMTKKIETEKGAEGAEQVTTTEYRYNDFNKIEEIKENAFTPDEAITIFVYDVRGNLSGSKDGAGNTISHGYDDLGRRIWTTKHFKDGKDIKTEFSFYANDLLKTVEDAHGNVTSYEYDDRKQLTKVTYPDATFVRYAYTEALEQDGITKYRVVTETQRNGTIVVNKYDELNRLVRRDISRAQGVGGPTAEVYEYDGLSRLTKAVNSNYTVERKYDPLDRLLEEKQMGETIRYTYSVDDNDKRRKMSVKYPNGRVIERD
ncbi:MAG: RHS repeat protein, partial [Candidatus Aminicenantes bacterium]|nr:RHS repeat protein [Candidatus Aminicenantes bacterium]